MGWDVCDKMCLACIPYNRLQFLSSTVANVVVLSTNSAKGDSIRIARDTPNNRPEINFLDNSRNELERKGCNFDKTKSASVNAVSMALDIAWVTIPNSLGRASQIAWMHPISASADSTSLCFTLSWKLAPIPNSWNNADASFITTPRMFVETVASSLVFVPLFFSTIVGRDNRNRCATRSLLVDAFDSLYSSAFSINPCGTHVSPSIPPARFIHSKIAQAALDGHDRSVIFRCGRSFTSGSFPSPKGPWNFVSITSQL
mmetsp:Transcript_12144/g.13832  ORF Transcript_12144/g.13832 Transcript_12144/m.13832 type:complete len:258 (+) Transcript_12144:1137-1910(+)